MENQTEKVNPQEKERLLSFIRVMSLVGLVIGVVSVIVGILVFVFLGGGAYPIVAGTGIWYGLMPITFGILGLSATFSTDETKQRNMINGHYTLSIVIVSMGYALAASIQGLVACSNKEDKCGSNPDVQTALHAILVCVIVFGYVLSSMSMGMHLRNRRVLHPDWSSRNCCSGN